MKSSDERRREAERAARQDPSDPAAQAAVQVEAARQGLTSHAFVWALLGKQVFIEGARMNYRGELLEVVMGPLGEVGALLLRGSRLVGFNAAQVTSEIQLGEVLVPWQYVHAVSVSPWR